VIRTARQGAVLVVTLARPERRNALDRAMVEALLRAFCDAAAGEAGAVLLAAEGAAFCAGADLEEMRALAGDEAGRTARAALTVALLEAPAALPLPVVAAMGGAAVGAGASLALACDAVVMAATARMAWPEARHGMVPRLVAPALLRHLGPKAAFDLLATGRAVEAAEAKALGLATKVVEPEVLLPEALAAAEALAALPRAALAGVKRLMAGGSA
jgi:enoyl-CoA hydratase